jgi:hypothetical protein
MCTILSIHAQTFIASIAAEVEDDQQETRLGSWGDDHTVSPTLNKDISSLRTCSVADPGCLSRIRIFSHPGSRIPDPKKHGEVKKKFYICFLTFL